MTVIADNKKRVVLPSAQPGERFDIKVSDEGRFILTPLEAVERPDNIRLVRKNGYTVAVGTRRIKQAQVRKFLDEFP